MTLKKYFVTLSEIPIFQNKPINDFNTNTTTSSQNNNSNGSNVGSTLGITGMLGSLGGLFKNQPKPLTSSWGEVSLSSCTYFKHIIAYVDFLTCGFNVDIIPINTNNGSDHNVKITNIVHGGRSYGYICDKITKQNILISDLNCSSFNELLIQLTIKGLVEIVEVEI